MEIFYIVVLEALGNPDHGENPYQYITKPTQITGKSIDEIVGYMSYNGRIWAERR